MSTIFLILRKCIPVFANSAGRPIADCRLPIARFIEQIRLAAQLDRPAELRVVERKPPLVEAEAPERYREQLRVYAEAARRALGLPAPPRTELWFLRSGRIVKL